MPDWYLKGTSSRGVHIQVANFHCQQIFIVLLTIFLPLLVSNTKCKQNIKKKELKNLSFTRLEFYSDVLPKAKTSFLDNLQKILHYFLSLVIEVGSISFVLKSRMSCLSEQ